MARRRKGSYADVSQIRRKFRKLPQELSREVRDVVTDVSQNIEKEAKSRVPVHTGMLRKYISAKSSRDGFTALIGYRTKTAKRKAWYAHFIEFGTKTYHPGDKRLAANRNKTTKILRRVVGAQPARPFLFPAAESNRKDFIRRARKAVKKSLRNLKKYNRTK